jgi:hypothetical protein
MAKVVLDEIEVRMKLINELQIKVQDKKTDEVQELQPLFEAGLWIFGPEFETIEYTSNVGMTKVLRDLFKINSNGSLFRPDFVVIPDGSIGVYSLPLYDGEDGSEYAIDKVIIIELKKPGIKIGLEQKDQCWKYVKELYEKGAITTNTKVQCFVLGEILDPLEANERSENDNRVRIRPMTYDTILTRANSRLLNLKKKIKNAPFLNSQLKQFAEKTESYISQNELTV